MLLCKRYIKCCRYFREDTVSDSGECVCVRACVCACMCVCVCVRANRQQSDKTDIRINKYKKPVNCPTTKADRA